MRFENKVVLITGSSSGIGRATALAFAREGARVVVNCKSNTAGAARVVEEIRALGRQAIAVQADVADPAQVDRLFGAALAAFGAVDILINNAGSAVGKPFLETTRDDWIRALDDNLIGTVLCSQRAAKIMLARGAGKILNTASIRGLEHTGRPGIMAYSAAKAAVINLTRTLAKELAPAIAVNAVAPGFVTTPNFDRMPAALVEEFIGGTLNKRFLDPAEIADAFLYLASTDAVTGEVLVVDGGFSLK